MRGAVGRGGQLTRQHRVGGVVEQPAGLVQQLTDRDGPAVVALAAHQPGRCSATVSPRPSRLWAARRSVTPAAMTVLVRLPARKWSFRWIRRPVRTSATPRGEIPRAAVLRADEHRGPRRVALRRQPPYGGAQDAVTTVFGVRARARPRVRVPARFRGRRAAAGQDECEGGRERHGGRHTAPPVPSYGGDGHDTDLRFLRTSRWSQVPRWPPRRAPDPGRFRVRG